MDNSNALARILIAGGIDDRNIAELDRGIRQARRFYDLRTETKLDKYQSVALDYLIAQHPDKVLLQLSEKSDWSFKSKLLYNVLLDGINIDGRIEEPITALLVDLTEIYFRLKATRKLGGNGPHYRFIKGCMEYLNLANAMPHEFTLRKTVNRALKRRNGNSIVGRYPKSGCVHGQN